MSGKKSALAHALAYGGAAFLVALVLMVGYAERRLSRLVLGGLGIGFSTRIYSAPFQIKEGVWQAPWRVVERLDRLHYRDVGPGHPAALGEYAWSRPTLEIYLRGFVSPMVRQESGLFSFTADSDNRWTIKSSSGGAVYSAAIEPEMIAELSGPERVRREPAVWNEIPDYLREAVVAVEDKRFYHHWGIDPRAMARSAWHDITRGGVWGGSTITQQLVKNLFLTPQRTLRRKLAEAALSLYVELRYSKRDILTIYLNHIYLGQDGAVGVAGVKAAAHYYFGKEIRDLDLAECAMLAGVIRSPYLYNPFRFPAAAKDRRDFVLKRMIQENRIGRPEYALAVREPLPVKRIAGGGERDEYAYFTAETIRRLIRRYPEDELVRYGLSIHTTVDPLLQRAAVRAIHQAQHQAALVAIDAASGRVLALTGGKDYGESQFNRATQAQRQPGSAFKPFVYGAALEAKFTPATILNDEPRTYSAGAGGEWNPANYEGVYFGTVTVRQALAKSLNAATLDLAGRVGSAKIVDFARRMGIESPLESSLALALGASEVNLLELTSAYAPFANGGLRVTPELITAVSDAEGNVLEYAGFGRSSAIDPALAYLMTSLMESVIQEGTASKASRLLGWDRPAAGKTGTTNDGRDAWFIGYTPELLAGVWVGEDSHLPIRATGAKDALPLWISFMHGAAPEATKREFTPPQGGLVSLMIDPLSGLLAGAGCPQQKTELFLEGTQPTQYCPLHPRGIVGWFKRLFGVR